MENYTDGKYVWMKKQTLEPEAGFAEMIITEISLICGILISILLLNAVLLGFWGRVIVTVVTITIFTGTTEALIEKIKKLFHADKHISEMLMLPFAIREGDKVSYPELMQFLKEQLEKEKYQFELAPDGTRVLACKNKQWYHVWYNQDLSFTIEWMTKDDNSKNMYYKDMLRDKGQLAYWVQRIHGEQIEEKEPEPGFCEKCGNQIISGAKFCNKCGNEIVRNEAPDKPVEKTGIKGIIGIILSAITIILGIVLVITIIRGKNSNNMIEVVKGAEFQDYPGEKIGKTLEDFCKSPEWSYESKNGEDYVTFSGKCQLVDGGKYVKLVIRFEILDIEDDEVNFQVDYIKIDGEKLDATDEYCVMDIIFGDGSNAAALMLLDWLYN